MERKSTTQIPNITQVRLWQIVKNHDQDKYVIENPKPLKGKIPEGRLTGLASRGEGPILADLSLFAMSNNKFLRTYTLFVKGGDNTRFGPKNIKESRNFNVVSLCKKTRHDFRKEVAKLLNIENYKEISDIISENPNLINELWDALPFTKNTIFVWETNIAFTKTLFENIKLYTIKDKFCIKKIVCHQNPEIGMKDIEIKF